MRDDHEREYVEYLRARMPGLRRLAYLLTGDFDRADDVVQTTATSLYVKWRQVRAAGNIDAYVRKMVVHTFLSEQRRSWARTWLTDRLPDRAAAEPPTDDALVVRDALRRLAPRQQAVLVLRFLCDLPVDETAAALGCAAGTVKSQTADGLAALRRILGPSAAATFGGGTR
ncbi:MULTISPECIES: SigE family RNA polymerase sigma factor [Dactylosporangium]|uniref:SigE family RNA polymerase sigma factor n=1 Tax=Dactylosporangium vinaceum TaxID=53362 RepID=A0ABV5M195_9ACTN|nr:MULTISPECIES: SigE family RNA polymerase sigma factor [Dactylosporangium]UAB97153.1 SigE family RNA polymerase sigma factor [Dactylosporangium vinaceum]UWZ45441.1 SigE family RNA polymerase sigma factor [Dactylosporangium matsuzakiense]